MLVLPEPRQAVPLMLAEVDSVERNITRFKAVGLIDNTTFDKILKGRADKATVERLVICMTLLSTRPGFEDIAAELHKPGIDATQRIPSIRIGVQENSF